MSTALRTYYRGQNLVAMRDEAAGQNRYYHFDHQGTTQCLTDSTGAVTDRFAADAWGVQVKRTGTSINRQWYVGDSGYQRQPEQPLDYVRARWFNALRARWISADPLRGEPVYVYVRNRPTVAIDARGLLSPTDPSDACCGYSVDEYLKDELRRYDLWVSRWSGESERLPPADSLPVGRALTATFANMCYKSKRDPVVKLNCWDPKRFKGRCARTVAIGGHCVLVSQLGNIAFAYAVQRFIENWPLKLTNLPNPPLATSIASVLLGGAKVAKRGDPGDLAAFELGELLGKTYDLSSPHFSQRCPGDSRIAIS
jgi:RHS repeat-associated protein